MNDKHIILTITGTISDEKTKILVDVVRVLQDELRGLDFNFSILSEKEGS